MKLSLALIRIKVCISFSTSKSSSGTLSGLLLDSPRRQEPAPFGCFKLPLTEAARADSLGRREPSTPARSTVRQRENFNSVFPLLERILEFLKLFFIRRFRSRTAGGRKPSHMFVTLSWAARLLIHWIK